MSGFQLDFDEVQKIQRQVQRISHTVFFNPDGSFTCKRVYGPSVTPEQFEIDIRKIMAAARRGRIEILEKRVEQSGPNVEYVVIRFRAVR